MNMMKNGLQAKGELAPVSQNERIQILDILRGFAVFGILVVNIGGFAAPSFWPGYIAPDDLPWYDDLAGKLVQFLAEAKFYSIFSFLFGLGFSVQLSRAAAKGRDIRSFYPRRLLILLGFGILHAVLLWTGDILRLYALLGFALLAFHRRATRTLLVWAGIFFSLSFLFLALFNSQGGAGTAGIPGLDLVGMARYAYTSGTYLEFLLFQAIASLGSFFVLLFTQGPSVMALFLLGLLAGRLRLFEQLPERRSLAKTTLLCGLALGLAGSSLMVFSNTGWMKALGLTLGAPALAAAYISALALLSLRPAGARLLAPLGQVGRMALTNYVLQSLVCAFLFYGFGLGLYERVGASILLGASLLIYLAQIPLSLWWLKRFQFGPLEWLWRSLTYRKRQPMRRQPVLEVEKKGLPASAA